MELVRENQAPIADNQARVNITFAGSNGDLPDAVLADATDAEIKQWATEAVRAGSVPGIGVHADADFGNFVVDRFPATEVRPFRLISLRPKTEFGR
jgi:hypothetical protein